MRRNVTIGVDRRRGRLGRSSSRIVATTLGSPEPQRQPVAQSPRPASRHAGRPRPRPQRPTPTAEPTASPSPTPLPTPTPVPTPVLVPAPLTGRLVIAGRRRAPPDRGHDRRPPARRGRSPACRRRRSSGRPRPRAASRATWRSSRTSCPKQIGPVRSSRYYYIAWAAEWRAVYAHAGGSPQALATLRSKGQRPVRLQRRRVPLQRAPSTGSPTRSAAAQPVHDRDEAAQPRQEARGQGQGLQGRLDSSRPDAPLEARPYGGTITVGYPYNTITYRYDRKTNTYLRSVTGETKQTDAADKTRIAPKNVVVMRMRFGPLNDGHPGAPRLEATVVGSGHGLDLDQRPDDQGHLEEDRDHQADPVLRQGRQRGHR